MSSFWGEDTTGPYETRGDGMNVYEDPEAVGSLFDEGHFDIDPRGKMSFTRCCRACIDRCLGIRQGSPLDDLSIEVKHFLLCYNVESSSSSLP